jgi:hypothetical protein
VVTVIDASRLTSSERIVLREALDAREEALDRQIKIWRNKPAISNARWRLFLVRELRAELGDR